MKLQLATSLLMAIELLSSAPIARAQTDSQVQTVRESLSGQRFLITYRDGGALYGTFYFLDVQVCPSGTYITGARSEKKIVLGNVQVNTWAEVGRWMHSSLTGACWRPERYVAPQASPLSLTLSPEGRGDHAVQASLSQGKRRWGRSSSLDCGSSA